MITLPAAYLEHARTIFADIDGILGQARHCLDPLEASSPFRTDGPEVPSVISQALRDQGLSLRETMATLLRESGISPMATHRSSLAAARAMLEHAILLADGLSPENWHAATALTDVAQQDARRWATLVFSALQDMTSQLDGAVAYPPVSLPVAISTDSADRLLARLDDIARHHQLRHMQRRLALVARRRGAGLRIAVAGRCGVGKSSLINYLIGKPVLPAGPLPTTCVPVCLRHGTRAQGEVRFADAASQRIDGARLAEFATTQANPGNRRHVVSIDMDLPSAAIPPDVTWIDMPPLADDGSAIARYDFLDELLACHLVVVAANATVPVWEVEAELIQRLCKAGVRVLVLLTKADLLEEDRLRVHERCQSWLWQTTGVRAPVGMAAVKGPLSRQCDDWRDAILHPAIAKLRDAEPETDTLALYELRMEMLWELQRRARLLAHASDDEALSPLIASSLALVDALRRQAPEHTEHTEQLVGHAVRIAAHNAVGLTMTDGPVLDLTDLLSDTANALVSSEAMTWWKRLLALRAEISLLIVRGADEAWRWSVASTALPTPPPAPRFDCSGTLPATILPRPQMAEIGRWMASHAIARKLLAHGAVESLREQIADYLPRLEDWRSRYLEQLCTALNSERSEAVGRSPASFRQTLALRLSSDIAFLGGTPDSAI